MRRLVAFSALLVACVAGAAQPLPLFPDEAAEKRPLWDRGCTDWPQDVDTEAFTIRRNPEIRTEKSDGAFRILARLVINAERGESPASVLASVERMLADGITYPAWVMPGVNDKPGGGRYFVTLDGLNVLEPERLRHYIFTGPYTFKVLWFAATGTSSVESRFETQLKTPDCATFAGVKVASKLTMRMTPRPGLLDMLMGELWALPTQQGAEVRIRIISRLAPFLHQLTPETLVRSEMDLRGRRLFQNFVDFRRLGAVPKASTSAPKKKRERGGPSSEGTLSCARALGSGRPG